MFVFNIQVYFFDSHKLNPITVIAVFSIRAKHYKNHPFISIQIRVLKPLIHFRREYVAFLELTSSVSSQPCWTPDISPFFSFFAWAAAECQQGLPQIARPLLLLCIQQNPFPRKAAKTLTLWEWERVISHCDQTLF